MEKELAGLEEKRAVLNAIDERLVELIAERKALELAMTVLRELEKTPDETEKRQILERLDKCLLSPSMSKRVRNKMQEILLENLEKEEPTLVCVTEENAVIKP